MTPLERVQYIKSITRLAELELHEQYDQLIVDLTPAPEPSKPSKGKKGAETPEPEAAQTSQPSDTMRCPICQSTQAFEKLTCDIVFCPTCGRSFSGHWIVARETRPGDREARRIETPPRMRK